MKVGIECMFTRVIQLSRDLDAITLKRMRQFRDAWRRAEIQNIARFTHSDHAGAAILYTLCRLLTPPSVAGLEAMPPEEVQLTLRGKRCSPWASALALHDLGAFDLDRDELEDDSD